MKTHISLIPMAVCSLMLLSACNKEQKLPDPAETYRLDYTLSQSAGSTYTNTEEGFLFTLQMQDASGNILAIILPASGTTIPTGSLTPEPIGRAGAGNYQISDKSDPAASSFLFGPYGKKFNIKDGNLTIDGGGNTYNISGMLSLSNGLYVNVQFFGAIPCEYVETPVAPVIEYDYVELTQVLSSTPGEGTLTLQLATPGIAVEQGMWGPSIVGEGNYLSLVIYSSDGKLAPGTYEMGPADGSVGKGQFGYGTVQEVDFMGMIFTINEGTTWYTLSGDGQAATSITSGDVVVEQSGDSFTILLNGGNENTLSARYVGPLAL